jgi:hypothetical protein
VVTDPFVPVLEAAVHGGLVAAALVDRSGNVIATAGPIDEDEAMPLAALVLHRVGSGDVAARLFAGEVLSVGLDERDVAVGVAQRQLFVVAVLGATTPGQLELVGRLRDRIACQLIKDDVTVRRERGKA